MNNATHALKTGLFLQFKMIANDEETSDIVVNDRAKKMTLGATIPAPEKEAEYMDPYAYAKDPARSLGPESDQLRHKMVKLIDRHMGSAFTLEQLPWIARMPGFIKRVAEDFVSLEYYHSSDLVKRFMLLINDAKDETLLNVLNNFWIGREKFKPITSKESSSPKTQVVIPDKEDIFFKILLDCIKRNEVQYFNFLTNHVCLETKPHFIKRLTLEAITLKHAAFPFMTEQLRLLANDANDDTLLRLLAVMCHWDYWAT